MTFGPGKLYVAVNYDGPGWLCIGETEGAVLELSSDAVGPRKTFFQETLDTSSDVGKIQGMTFT